MNVERKREPVNFLTLPAEVTIGVFLIEVILSSIWICHGAFILENVDLKIITLQEGLLSFVAFVAAWKIARGWAAFMCVYELRFSRNGFYYFNKSNKEFCPPHVAIAIIILGSTLVVICAAASQPVANPYAEFLIYGLGAGSFTGVISVHFKFYVQRLYVGYPDSMHHFLENLGRSTGLIVTSNFIPYLLTAGPITKGRTILSCMVAAAVYPIASVIHRRGLQHLKRELQMDEEYAAYLVKQRNQQGQQASPSTSAVQTTQPTTTTTSQPSTSQCEPSTSQFQAAISPLPPSPQAASRAQSTQCEPSTSQFQAAISPPSPQAASRAPSIGPENESTDEDQTSHKNIFMSLWRFELLFPAVITAATFGLALVMLATIPFLECRGFGQNCEHKKQAVNNLNYVAFVWLVVVCCMYLNERFQKRSSLYDFLTGIAMTGTSVVIYSYRKFPAMTFAMFGGGLGLMAYHECYFYWYTVGDKSQFETIKPKVEALTGIVMLMACLPIYYSGWRVDKILNYVGYFYYVMTGVILVWVLFPYAKSRISILYMSYMERRRTREDVVASEIEMQVFNNDTEETQNQAPALEKDQQVPNNDTTGDEADEKQAPPEAAVEEAN